MKPLSDVFGALALNWELAKDPRAPAHGYRGKLKARQVIVNFVEKVASGDIVLNGLVGTKRRDITEPLDFFDPIADIARCGGVEFRNLMVRKGTEADILPAPSKRVPAAELRRWAEGNYDTTSPLPGGILTFRKEAKTQFGEGRVTNTLIDGVYRDLWPGAKQGRRKKS